MNSAKEYREGSVRSPWISWRPYWSSQDSPAFSQTALQSMFVAAERASPGVAMNQPASKAGVSRNQKKQGREGVRTSARRRRRGRRPERRQGPGARAQAPEARLRGAALEVEAAV